MLKTILALATVLSACTDAAPVSTIEAFPAPQQVSRTRPSAGALDAASPPAAVTVLANHERGATLFDHENESSVDLPDSPCGCGTEGCVSQWIEDNIGCNIVVDLVCLDGARGGLVKCAEQNPRL